MLYGYKKQVQLGYEQTVEKLKEEMKKEGFGVLTEIDVRATLKKKLDVDFDKYTILGACNPSFAHKALRVEPDVGLMLPCNVIVYEQEGKTLAAAILPTIAMSMIDNERLRDISEQVEAKLKQVIDRL